MATTSPMLANASKTLAWNLHVDMLKQSDASQNYVLSPYSMSTAFGMALLGACGTTYDEMVKSLGLPSNVMQEDLIVAFRMAHDGIKAAVDKTDEKKESNQEEAQTSNNWAEHGCEDREWPVERNYDRKVPKSKGPPSLQLDTAIKLYAQQDIGKVREDYLVKLEKAFADRALEQVDFRTSSAEVCAQINAFVEQATRGKIKKIVQSLDPKKTSLVLVSAVYMKAKWATKFEKRQTTERGEFYVAHKKRLRNDVPLMRKCHYMKYAENGAAQFVWLPYEGRQVQMVIAVPKARDGGLNALKAAVSAAGGFGPMLKSLKIDNDIDKVDLTLPRFKIESSVVLNDMMKRLGMKKAFEERNVGGFSDMMEKGPACGENDLLAVWIGMALQKVVIEVDESGTEAAAATYVEHYCDAKPRCMSRARPPRIVVVKADKPFMYWIEHVGSGMVLFSGAVVNP